MIALMLASGCKRTDRATISDRDPDRSVASSSREAETDTNVGAALASEGCKINRQDRRVLYVRCGDSGEESALNLENFDGLVQAVPTAGERRAQAFKFVHRLVSDTTLPATPPLERLLMLIRPQDYVQASVERMLPNETSPEIVSFPFPGELVVIAAVDTPGNTQMVSASTLVRWKVNAATVYAKAIENFDAHPLPWKRINSDESTVTIYRLASADDENEASRLLSAKSRASVETLLGGRAVFAIPDRRQLLASRADDARSVRALRALTAEYVQGPLRISGDLFEADGQGSLRVVR
jgi:hypothetical protein